MQKVNSTFFVSDSILRRVAIASMHQFEIPILRSDISLYSARFGKESPTKKKEPFGSLQYRAMIELPYGEKRVAPCEMV